MNKRTYVIKEHYLVEIDKPRSFNSGTWTNISRWEIFIAVEANGFEYRGKAVELGNPHGEVPWTTIPEPEDGLGYLTQIIERKIQR